MDDDKIAKLAETVATVAIKVGTAAAAGPVPAATAGFLAFLPPTLGEVIRRTAAAKAKRQARQVEQWLAEVGRLIETGKGDDAAGYILEHIDEGWAHDSVAEAVRAIFLDIDEAALPALAAVTALQVSRRQVERRDRRAIALLLDCDSGAITALQSLICRSEEALGRYKGRLQVSFFTLAPQVTDLAEKVNPNRLRLQLLPIGKSGVPVPAHKVTATTKLDGLLDRESFDGAAFDMSPAVESDSRAFDLLQRHGFFVLGQTISNSQLSEGESLDLLATADDIRYLHQVLRR